MHELVSQKSVTGLVGEELPDTFVLFCFVLFWGFPFVDVDQQSSLPILTLPSISALHEQNIRTTYMNCMISFKTMHGTKRQSP
jgi:hypothetical protein